MKLEEFLKKSYNYDSEVKDNMSQYINQWKSWYVGNVKDFHNYFVYNGQKRVPQVRFTMNMAKEISEDWADILWSEKCEISMKDESSNKEFKDLVNELDLYSVINQTIEKSGALGTVATVVSVYDLKKNEDTMILDVKDSKTRVDIVDIDWIFPLSWNNKTITECAFGSVQYNEGKKYVILSVHKIASDGNYHIYNHLFKSENDMLTEITNESGVESEFNTKSNKKWFSIFKPNITNNIFSNSPFGIPHYANAIDNLKAVDLSFDALKTEIQVGKRRTFVSADMLSYQNGEQKLVFDENDISIYVLPKGVNVGDLIQHDNEDLRTDKQIASVNMNLNILGNKVGFGENHYHFDGTNLSTATAVISSNSKLFRRKKKLEIGYESAIYDLVVAISYASSEFGKYNINTEDFVVKFDDSIIEDKETESNRAMREVNAGLLSKIEYRAKIFGETEEIAKQKLEEVEEENPSVEDLIGNNKESSFEKKEDKKEEKK